MSNTNANTTLRINGYSADSDGIILRREGRRSYQDEATAVMRVTFERESKTLREMSESLIAFCDEPAALVGRAKNGVVVLFKSEGFEPPTFQSVRDSFNLALEATGESFTVSFEGVGNLDVSAYTWKDRSPLTVARHALPTFYADTGVAVIHAALNHGCTWGLSEAEAKRERETAARIAKLKLEIAQGLHAETDDEKLARQDEELSARSSRNVSPSDGVWATFVIGARQRIAARTAARAAAEQRKKKDEQRARLAQEA